MAPEILIEQLLRDGRRALLGLAGAPETFDAAGFVALLEALRRGGDVRVPDFDGGLEVPEEVRVRRLVARFVSFGWPPDAARERVLHGTDAGVSRIGQAGRMPTEDVRQLSTREVYRNPWLRLREDEVEFADGSRGQYAVVDKADFVVVLAHEDDGFWLVQQYRYPVGSRQWEFPQGGWPPGRTGTPAELAAAELREETGLRAERLDHLGRLFAGYGFCSQGYDVFLATGLTQGTPERETTEADMVHAWHPVATLREMLRRREFADAHSIAALALYDNR